MFDDDLTGWEQFKLTLSILIFFILIVKHIEKILEAHKGRPQTWFEWFKEADFRR